MKKQYMGKLEFRDNKNMWEAVFVLEDETVESSRYVVASVGHFAIDGNDIMRERFIDLASDATKALLEDAAGVSDGGEDSIELTREEKG